MMQYWDALVQHNDESTELGAIGQYEGIYHSGDSDAMKP